MIPPALQHPRITWRDYALAALSSGAFVVLRWALTWLVWAMVE